MEYRDWSITKRINERGDDTSIQSSNRATTFSRISWTPTGSHLVASRGINKIPNKNDKIKKYLYFSPVYTRGTWLQQIKFTGHKSFTIASKFAPDYINI